MKYGIALLLLMLLVAAGVVIIARMPENAEVPAAEPLTGREEEDEERRRRLEDSFSDYKWTAAPTPEQAKAEIFTAEEQQRLQAEALQAARLCAGVYGEAVIRNAGTKNARVEGFNKEQGREAAKQLGAGGLISVAEHTDMENYEGLEAFCAAYTAGQEAMATVFSVQKDGAITARTFLYRGGAASTYFVTIGWQEGGVPELRGAGETPLSRLWLTDKGYMFYVNDMFVAHGNMIEYYRVKPLPKACKELTEAYLQGLSYVNYKLLVTNWDESNVTDIVIPRMFEDLYRIATGENFRTENGRIAAALYEAIMTAYLPVTVEQLRETGSYSAESDSYAYDMIFPTRFPPFGEVVDFTENGDGTITLFVDGVWPDYGSDYAFTNRIVVQPLEGGRFRFLSNAIEKQELDIPAVQ